MADSSDFEENFDVLMKNVIQAIMKKGMLQAGRMLLRDAIMEEPMVPLDEGTLRGSGSVFVNNELVGTSGDLGQEVSTPASADDQPIPADTVIGTVGFNTPYAAHLHEHPEYEFQHAGTGGKYLESKLVNGNLYFQAIADVVKEELDKEG